MQEEQEQQDGTGSFGQRASIFMERMENAYLRILRAFILILATFLIIYAAGLALVSLFKMSRSPESVVEKIATVNGNDLIPAVSDAPPSREKGESDAPNPEHVRFYRDFSRRYHALFRTKFEPFRQPDDKQLTPQEFEDAYLETQDRLDSIKSGSLVFDADKADLGLLLTAMTEAASLPETVRRLNLYKNARKVKICREVERIRTTYRDGWDRFSTNCYEWYYEPVGCPVRRAVQTPYTERVCEMQFPEGTRSHANIFRSYNDQFFTLLTERRDTNAARAARERSEIEQGNLDGEESLITSGWIFAGFLTVMFFFLLIAIERHQRRISDQFKRDENDSGAG